VNIKNTIIASTILLSAIFGLRQCNHPPAITIARELPKTAKSPVVLTGTTPTELNKLWDSFERPTSPHSFDYRTFAKLDSPLVTEIYQAQPGYFVVSTVTPSRRAGEGGTPHIVIHAETTRFGLDGSSSSIIKIDLTVPPRGGVSSNTTTNDGRYRLTISPSETSDPNELDLHIEGLFREPLTEGKK
jgi:hypothetical protein